MITGIEYKTFVTILEHELVPALGCTEPIAIAYAAAKAREVLGQAPSQCVISCSGNIIKNVQSVTVPHSGGAKGIEAAAILGAIAGNPKKKLAVLEDVTPDDCKKMHKLADMGFCKIRHVQNVDNLYILAEVKSSQHTAAVEIKNTHTNITKITKDNRVLYDDQDYYESSSITPDKSLLSIRRILDFADQLNVSDVDRVLEAQITCNMALSEEGFKGEYGSQVGKTLAAQNTTLYTKISAAAAAASDARMNGCSLPAVINSGSGNQGITASVPLIVYAREQGIDRETLIRGLAVSNLISIHQKKYIGSLSAYCGAVSAACGAVCGIAYLQGYGYEIMSHIITNTLGTISGMICDGAKASCAFKIATALQVSMVSFEMAKKDRTFMSGDGIVKCDVEKTIESIGRIARIGMKQTDNEIISIMLDDI